MSLPLLLAIVLAFVAIVFVLYPLFAPVARSGRQQGEWRVERSLAARRAQLYREIADLDFDFQVGKVAPADYQLLREELLRRAADLLREEDREAEELDRAIEAEVAALRRARASRPADRCPRCERPFQPDDVFCARCGAPRAPAVEQPAGSAGGSER